MSGRDEINVWGDSEGLCQAPVRKTHTQGNREEGEGGVMVYYVDVLYR